MVLCVPSRTRTREVYSRLNWTDLQTKWKINRCLMVHKCLNNNVPEYLQNHFNCVNHRYNTRQSENLSIPRNRTVQGQRSFKYTGTKDYNSIPQNLKSIESHQSFKRNVKCHFQDLYKQM